VEIGSDNPGGDKKMQGRERERDRERRVGVKNKIDQKRSKKERQSRQQPSRRKIHGTEVSTFSATARKIYIWMNSSTKRYWKG